VQKLFGETRTKKKVIMKYLKTGLIIALSLFSLLLIVYTWALMREATLLREDNLKIETELQKMTRKLRECAHSKE
jgi:hypothetical protein